MSCILQHKQVAQRELFPVEMMLAVVCVVLFMILAYLQYRIRRVKKRGKHCIVNLFFGCLAPVNVYYQTNLDLLMRAVWQ